MKTKIDLLAGHSRTIIGIEEQKDGSLRLLLFDPSCNKKQMQSFHEDITANLMRTIRRTLHSMRAKQYQIVAVVGVLTDKEYEVRTSAMRVLICRAMIYSPFSFWVKCCFIAKFLSIPRSFKETAACLSVSVRLLVYGI